MALIGKLRFSLSSPKNFYSLSNYLKFSTPATSQEPFQHFRTSEDNPTRHTHNHVGKFYRIDKNIKEMLFFNGGIPKSLDIQMKTFQEHCIMVREPFLEITSFLQKINFSHPAVRFVLYGRNGTGKSLTLAHLVHYAYVSKFLLLHVPWDIVNNDLKSTLRVLYNLFSKYKHLT